MAKKATAAKKKAARKIASARKTASRRATATRKAVKRAVKTAVKTVRRARKTAARKKRKPSAAFMRPVTPSAALAAVIGPRAVPRTEVTKRLWAYIKKHRLQDLKNRRMINADAPLRAVFGGRAAVNMFEMTRLVGKHLK